jgi:signal transduction histidine kinase
MGEEASRQKDEFLAVLSHELRTPLNTVLGYARMLRREDRKMTEPQRERALDALERNADTLTRLVGDILDTSRIVTGKLRLALTETSIDEVIHLALETIHPAADAKGIAIGATPDTGLTVLADRDRLVQIVWNLLSNAIKFTPSGGRIDIRAQGHPGSVTVSVEDTGVGISEEHLAQVFQRFWQAHTGTSREYAGLGIGLALARHLVELHGGEIAARSEGPGRGSVFTVTLPSRVRTGQKSLR